MGRGNIDRSLTELGKEDIGREKAERRQGEGWPKAEGEGEGMAGNRLRTSGGMAG